MKKIIIVLGILLLPLHYVSAYTMSSLEVQYRNKLSEIDGQIAEVQQELNQKQAAYEGSGITKAKWAAIAQPYYDTINSLTNSYNWYVNEINKLMRLSQDCEYKNAYYDSDLGQCICKNGYKADTFGNSCILDIKTCSDVYGAFSIDAGNNQCGCMHGYVWNDAMTNCIKLTKDVGDKQCSKEYGSNAEAASDDYTKCICKEGYGWNSNKTSCVRMSEDEKCQLAFGNNSYSPVAGYCDCKDGYERSSDRTYCVKVSHNYDQECRDTYGAYSIASPTDPANYCTCKDGYTMNKENTYCIPASNDCKDRYGQYATYSNGSCTCLPGYVQPRDGGQCVTEQESCTLLYGMGAYLSSPGQCSCKVGYHRNNNTTLCIQDTNTPNTFSAEFKDAYEFAYANNITTMPTIEEANMNGQIIRAEIAKMLANWVKSLGYTPDTSAKCNFTDIGGVKGDLYTAIIESCQLGIMGQGITKFRPFDNINRGEVATAISRILWGHQYDGGNPYYESHLNALRASGILSDTSNPDFKELRGNVMVMLMRASVDGDVECDDPLIVLACVDNGEDCPEICRSDYDINKVIDYNNKVIEIAQNCISSQDEILEEAEKDNASSDKVKKLTNNTIDKCKEAILGLDKLGDWNGDNTLKNGVLLVVASNIAYYKEFLKLVPFLDIDNMTSSQEKEYNEITSKLKDLNLKLDKVNEDLMMIQEKFAKKHGFELEG